MKLFCHQVPAVAVVVLAALLAEGRHLAATSTAEARRSTPVSRVVKLLQGLQEKLEADLKAEENLFKKYECWYRSVKDVKTFSNTAAESRISSLDTYVKDIEAGRYEFTTERVDLEKQIDGLSQDLQTAASLRSAEHKDYRAARTELQQALTALADAIQVLQAGTSLTQRGVRVFGARKSLQRALELGRGLLTKEDTGLLEQLLRLGQPAWDWKKINRKATFKEGYVAQSGEIVRTLKSLQKTFTSNLAAVEAKEREASSTYDALKASKESMLDTTRAALVALVQENGARGLTKSEAKQEIAALQAQVDADKGFIAAAQSAYDVKHSEWVAREELRRKEITAISEAIAVLHSDGARDKFKDSYRSQGYSLLQAESRHRQQLTNASRILGALATSSADARVALLHKLAASGGIAQVIVAIDNLVNILSSEAKADLDRKEYCESQLANKTRQAQVQSRAIDGLTDDIASADEKLASLLAQMEEENDAISGFNETLLQMENQRADEARQFEIERKMDMDAIMVVDEALQILKTMQQDLLASSSGSAAAPPTSLLQRREPPRRDLAAMSRQQKVFTAHSAVEGRRQLQVRAVAAAGAHVASGQPYVVEAGQAPLPPPPTWEDPAYSGAEESGGIVSIITMLKEDLRKDMDLAASAENSAQQAYATQKNDVEASIQAAKDAIVGYHGEQASVEGTKNDKANDKVNKKADLENTVDSINGLTPGCNFALVNFDVRVKNRQVEVDGLIKAKAILQGAAFA